MDYRSLIDKAVGQARSARQKIEMMIKPVSEGGQGLANDSPEVRAEYETSERFIVEAEQWKEAAEREERQEQSLQGIETWQRELQGVPPITITAANQAIGPMQSLARSIRGDPETSTPEYRTAFDGYLRHLPAPHGFGDAERHVLQTQVDVLGGYTVPADLRAEIIRRVGLQATVLQKCRPVPTSRDQIEWPRVKPHPTDGSIYTSAFVGSWVPEIPATTAGEAEPQFGMFVIPVRKGRAKCQLSMDMVADAVFDVMGFLRDDGADNLSLVVDKAIIAGAGVNGEPRGLLNVGIATTDISGTTADTISNTTSDIGSAPKLIDFVYSLPEQYAPNASIMLRRLTEASVRKLVDASGRFIWTPGFAGEPDILLGYPTAHTPFMEAEGTDGNKVMVIGDFRQMIVPVRQDLTAQVLLERYADVEQVGIILRTRLGCDVANPDAFRIGVV